MPDAAQILWAFVLPLAGVPAASWGLNRILTADRNSGAGELATEDIVRGLQGAVTVYACAVISVAVLTVAIALLAPLFDRPRDWTRALAVAGYSGAPLYLGGVLLLLPGVSFVLLIAALHSAYLLYGGLRIVMGVKESSAAEYVALGTVLLIAASTLLGALGGALGLL